MDRDGLGTVAARKNGDVATLVPELAGELLDDGGLAGAADREIADGDDLHAKGGVSQDAHVIKKPAAHHGELKNLGQSVQQETHERGLPATPFFQDDLQQEGLEGFPRAHQVMHHYSLPSAG